jgi:hypothetical protein
MTIESHEYVRMKIALHYTKPRTMKIIYSLIIATLFSMGIHAQSFTLNFEDTAVINQVFYTDSIIDPQGIWQIGPPHKSFMNDTYSPPNAIVTLLDSLLPPNSKGSFIITLPNVGFQSFGLALTFVHRFQFDSARGGGYVEFSVDSGRKWHNINTYILYPGLPPYFCLYQQPQLLDSQMVSLPTWWNGFPSDTTSSGAHYFTGTDSIWMFDTILLPTAFLPEKTNAFTPFLFRFTAYTDSSASPSAGWMIDNINLCSFGNICGGGINEINSAHLKVYPNPATDAFDISILNEPESNYHVTLYDLAGRAVAEKDFNGASVTMQRGDIDAGSYFIQVTDMRTSNTFQKRVVFD